MNLEDVTPLILTCNEAANIARTLAALSWARQILVVDSGSVDETRALAEAFPQASFVAHPYEGHARQLNWGLDRISTEWTLALDADYLCPPSLATELAELTPQFDAYEARFAYAVKGRPLRRTLYPPRVVLFRTHRFRHVQDGHKQVLDLGGAPAGRLRARIVHDDRKPLARWLSAQALYASLEAEKLLTAPSRQLSWKDRVRRGVVWAPPLMLVYCLLGQRLIFDGWSGLYYSLQRAYAELLLSLELLDRRLHPRPNHDASCSPTTTEAHS